MIEIIVLDKESAIEAEKAGADRLELVKCMEHGGLTPDTEVILNVCAAVSIPVYVMVRPHEKSFSYSREDQKNIFMTINTVKELGGSGVVFGCLTPEGDLDEELINMVIERTHPLPMTFHRAIDEAKNPLKVYQKLLKYPQVTRVLSSGGQATAVQGINILKKMIELEKKYKGPTIMPGSGVNITTLPKLHSILNATEYHVGSGARIDGSFQNGIDPSTVKKMKRYISRKRLIE